MTSSHPVLPKPRRRPRRWLRWVIIIAIVAAGAVWFARPQWYGVAVTVLVPARGAVEETVIGSGRVRAASQAQIASTIAGRVRAIEAVEGAEILAGQNVITLDDADALSAVVRAEAPLTSIAAARAELDKRRAPAASEALKQARTALSQAERDFARDRDLAAKNALTAADLERTTTALSQAQSRVRAANIDVRALRADGPEEAALAAREAEAEAVLAQARIRLSQHVITAPMAGVIIERRVEPGDVVAPGTPLLLLAEKGRDTLVIEPDEKFLGVLALGQTAVASADAFPERTFAAKVAWIAPAIDARRGTVEVRLEPLEHQPFLKPDMTISVEIAVARRDNTITLPRNAIRDLATSKPWVMVIAGENGDRAVRRDIRPGIMGDEVIEVLEGISETDRVIIPAPALPALGAKVRVPGGGT